MSGKLESLLQSRRFWAAVIAVAVVVLQDGMGLGEDVAKSIAAVLSAWIVGDSLQKTK